MDKRESDNIKRLVIVFAFILIIIVILIGVILLTHKSNNIPSSNNTVNNTNTNKNTTSDNNQSNETNSQNTNSENNVNNNNSNNSSNVNKLEKTIDKEVYFWLKDRISMYFSSNELNEPTKIIDTDVIDELKLTKDNYRRFNNFDGAAFRIDEIYEQTLDNNKCIYVVKLKYGKSEDDVKDTILWVKRDRENKTFSIYPYEYIRIKNYTNFKEGDILPVNNAKKIEKNSENQYEEDDNRNISAEMCMKGLFERYKFDLILDNNHLYNLLEEDYKNAKYSSVDDLKRYIKQNKVGLYLDTLNEYKVINYSTYIEYRAICNSKRNFVFNARNMMDYTISLDNYSIVQNEETYDAFFPAAQAKYCVDRIVQAINYRDYDFVYSKLDPVQKNNYYRNKNDFNDFLDQNSYSENDYNIGDDYLIISDNVYQFTVTLVDVSGKDNLGKTLTMAITLKDGTDFTMSVVSGKR